MKEIMYQKVLKLNDEAIESHNETGIEQSSQDTRLKC